MGSKRRFNHLHYLIIITLVGGFLRFYNLQWGDGFFFHPDENNMARAVTQLCIKSEALYEINSFALESGVAENCSMNPHFYAYGQFPLYLAYFSSWLKDSLLTRPLLQSYSAPFSSAIFWLRFWSAAVGTLTIPLVYLVTKQILTPKRYPLLAALFVSFTPGLLQSSHFGTTESLLTFFFMLILYLSLKFCTKTTADRHTILYIILLAFVSGLALATKPTALFFLVAPVIALLLYPANSSHSKSSKKILNLGGGRLSNLVIFLGTTLLFTVFFSPYNILDYEAFLSSLRYETAVATGQTPVFYTRQFIDTTPLLYQATHILPFALGIPLFILGILGFINFVVMPFMASKNRSSSIYGVINHTTTMLLAVSFLIYLIPNALLFAKWTRFMTPTFPFFAIFAAYALYSIHKKTASSEAVFGVGKGFYPHPLNNRKKSILPLKQFVKSDKLRRAGDSNSTPLDRAHRLLSGSGTLPIHPPHIYIITIFIIILSTLPGLYFFKIYTRPDTRVAASEWIYENVPPGSYILSETGNVVDIPVSKGQSFRGYDLVNFDFYHLDENPELQQKLLDHLVAADYILIPSRRIYANLGVKGLSPKSKKDLALNSKASKYPITAAYYSSLFSGYLGFSLAHTESPDSVLRHPSSVLQPEETWQVFDHPTVHIYRKTKQYNRDYYEETLSAHLDN